MAGVDTEIRDGTFGYVKPRTLERTGITTQTTDHGTKNKSIKSPTHDNLPSFPGDFEIQLLDITSPNREGEVTLLPHPKDGGGSWSELNIYEDIFSNCLTANVQLTDGVGLMEDFPIVGEETIHIQIKTKGIKKEREELHTGPFKGSDNEGRIDLKFRVYKISDITRLNEGLTSCLLYTSDAADE